MQPSIAGWMDVTRRMRAARYDAAIDFQGLMKSAVLARASGAPRVIGFSIWHLREKTARPFYSETGRTGNGPAAGAEHVIHKNLALLAALGIHDERVRLETRAILDYLDTAPLRAELGRGVRRRMREGRFGRR